ncbi:hypothetical protein B0O99DRAFT_739124 [Bisporella sp. PMI_857]|nr:hypothetical protein B0O99DRAFT_739124 [Bisporella sp. PMI_857]
MDSYPMLSPKSGQKTLEHKKLAQESESHEAARVTNLLVNFQLSGQIEQLDSAPYPRSEEIAPKVPSRLALSHPSYEENLKFNIQFQDIRNAITALENGKEPRPSPKHGEYELGARALKESLLLRGSADTNKYGSSLHLNASDTTVASSMVDHSEHSQLHDKTTPLRDTSRDLAKFVVIKDSEEDTKSQSPTDLLFPDEASDNVSCHSSQFAHSGSDADDSSDAALEVASKRPTIRSKLILKLERFSTDETNNYKLSSGAVLKHEKINKPIISSGPSVLAEEHKNPWRIIETFNQQFHLAVAAKSAVDIFQWQVIMENREPTVEVRRLQYDKSAVDEKKTSDLPNIYARNCRADEEIQSNSGFGEPIQSFRKQAVGRSVNPEEFDSTSNCSGNAREQASLRNFDSEVKDRNNDDDASFRPAFARSGENATEYLGEDIIDILMYQEDSR